MKTTKINILHSLALGACLLAVQSPAQITLYSNDFEAYSTVATSAADISDADPVGTEWAIVDDTALLPTTAGAGVQVINWIPNAGGQANQCILLNPNSEATIGIPNLRTGSRYIVEFKTYVVRKQTTANQNFRFTVRGMGSDNNNDEIVTLRVANTANNLALQYYDGIAPVNTSTWQGIGVNQTPEQWQSWRVVIYPLTQTADIYVGDMATPAQAGVDFSRGDVAVPTQLRLQNDGNSADDGYVAYDDFVVKVVDPMTELTAEFTEGFESYPARTSETDDADPGLPWIVSETDGPGNGKLRNPAKVQVVDSSVVPPHSGAKCLKLEGGHRGGATIAWGAPPMSDVQITWWARVPESVVVSPGIEFTYLRMSLYAMENGNPYSGDCALLGYGIRNATIGDATSLTYYTTGWLDTKIDYTPNTWEEYQLTTMTSSGRYTIIKNPSSPNPEVVVDQGPMIGSGITNWAPIFMAAWSSSNGSNHPPVYVDDIKVRSLTSVAVATPTPYVPTIEGTRFTNYTVLTVPGPVGAATVDPRDDSTIVFAMDAAAGSLQVARKVASGNWAVDPVPLVSGIANPSGLTIGQDGTIWWVNDMSMALMRLKAPWASNLPERVIKDFGVLSVTNTVQDDDPFDVCIAPPGFSGSLAKAGDIIIMDRGLDDNPWNTLVVVNPATTELEQTNYTTYLTPPSDTILGSGDLVAMTTLPATHEVATLYGGNDGQVSAVNGDGLVRTFWPSWYPAQMSVSGMTTDPTTQRIWIADDLGDTIWSCEADGSSSAREISFPLTDPSRTDKQIDFQEPGLKFSPGGSLLLASDTSTINGGGRLIIFHREAFALPTIKINNYSHTPTQFQLSWESAGAAKYDVLRGNDLQNVSSFVPVGTNILTTSFIDTNSAGPVFYRVVAKP